MSKRGLEPGTTLQAYTIESVLGEGGFGVTYLARDIASGGQVAIKEYLPSDFAVRHGDKSIQPVSEHDAEEFRLGREHFLQEARVLKDLHHPNVVRVLDVIEVNHTVCMVMEYVRGDSLAALLARTGVVTEADLLRIAIAVLNGLEAMHTAGIIHREIKEPNILLREDGTPVLIDFGATRMGLFRRRRMISQGLYNEVGTLPLGGNAESWTDIHALGAMLYRLAMGRGKSQGTRGRAATAAPVACSPEFLDVLKRALTVSANERLQSASEWRIELEAVQRSLQISIPGSAPLAATTLPPPVEPLYDDSDDDETVPAPDAEPVPVAVAMSSMHVDTVIPLPPAAVVSQPAVAATNLLPIVPIVHMPQQERTLRRKPRPAIAVAFMVGFVAVAMFIQRSERPSDPAADAGTAEVVPATAPVTSTALDGQDLAPTQVADMVAAGAAVTPAPADTSPLDTPAAQQLDQNPATSVSAAVSVSETGTSDATTVAPDAPAMAVADVADQAAVQTDIMPAAPQLDQNPATSVSAAVPVSEASTSDAMTVAPDAPVVAVADVADQAAVQTDIAAATGVVIPEAASDAPAATVAEQSPAQTAIANAPDLVMPVTPSAVPIPPASAQPATEADVAAVADVAVPATPPAVPPSTQPPAQTDVAVAAVEPTAVPADAAVPVPPSSAVDDATPAQTRIVELLAQAEADVAALRLTKPRDNNAFEKYQEVLALEPQHAGAQRGLQVVSDRYVALATTAMNRQRFAAADRYLDLALKVEPGNSAVAVVRRELDQRRQQSSPSTSGEPVVAGREESFPDRMKALLRRNQSRTSPPPASRAEEVRERWGAH